MKQLLIRADDLGYSVGVNYGIYTCVKAGLVNNVGLMSNMEYAQMGVELLKQEDVCIGQHTNICVGKPLCDPKLIPSLVNESGAFKSSAQYRNAKEDFVVLEEAILEIEAQYERFVELTGTAPKYFEGHAIRSATFFQGLAIVAKRHHLPYFKIQSSGDCWFDDIPCKAYVSYAEEFSTPLDALRHAAMQSATDDKQIVFVTHPGFLDEYLFQHSSLLRPRCQDVAMLCAKETKQWLQEHDISLIRYDECKLIQHTF